MLSFKLSIHPTKKVIDPRKFSEESELNRYFSTIENGLTTMNEPYDNPDLGHFDALSEIRLGELFAEELVRIYQTTL